MRDARRQKGTSFRDIDIEDHGSLGLHWGEKSPYLFFFFFVLRLLYPRKIWWSQFFESVRLLRKWKATSVLRCFMIDGYVSFDRKIFNPLQTHRRDVMSTQAFIDGSLILIVPSNLTNVFFFSQYIYIYIYLVTYYVGIFTDIFMSIVVEISRTNPWFLFLTPDSSLCSSYTSIRADRLLINDSSLYTIFQFLLKQRNEK